MNFHIVASGSSGNCVCMEHGGEYVFVDVGVPVSRVREVIDPSGPVKLFITHEHWDHICGLDAFINRYSPSIYTSEMTADVLVEKGVDPDGIFVLDADKCYDFKSFSVKPFNLSHDAVQPFGYKFNIDNKYVSFATDLGVVSDYILRSLEGSEVLLLESNYEEELLKKSRYPAMLKSRISSYRGHLSNRDAMRIVGEMSCWGLKRCFLAHVSENSNDYDLLDRYAKTCEDCYKVETNVIRQRSVYQTTV